MARGSSVILEANQGSVPIAVGWGTVLQISRQQRTTAVLIASSNRSAALGSFLSLPGGKLFA